MKTIGLDSCILPEVNGYHDLIVCIDYFTKWLETNAVRDKTALTVTHVSLCVVIWLLLSLNKGSRERIFKWCVYLFAQPYWCTATYSFSIPSAIKWSLGEAKQHEKECLDKSTGCISRGVVTYHWRCSICTSRKSTFVNKMFTIFLNLQQRPSFTDRH